MADKLKQSQLARIVVPVITDAEYSTGLADAFDKINDNFKKIASLPFLQGVQGDSYQLEEYKIWEKDETGNWILTEDGKVLLDSIFGIDTTKNGNSFNDVRTCIGQFMPEEGGVSPIDFFKNGNDIVNNSLYFYVIKDDTGNVIEKQLGQYYYFVDGRLKEIGDIYNSENASSILSVFNDYTGFYQYKYDIENSNSKYIKVEILPTIYYDQIKNDICWKFNGNKTGISALGIKGADGNDAIFSIVLVDLTGEDGVYSNNSTSGEVIGILDTSASSGEDVQWKTDPKYFKTGKALIYLCGKIHVENQGEASTNPITGETKIDELTINDFAFGEINKQGDNYIAFWDPNCVFNKVITNGAFTQYFYNMGTVSYPYNSAYFLAIPSIQDRVSSTVELKQHAHIIKGYEGSKESKNESLNIFYSDNAFDEYGNQIVGASESIEAKNLNIKNYNVNISKTLTTNGGAIITGESTGVGSTGGTGLVVRAGSNSKGEKGLGIKVENGAEFYSGTGATTDSNILKVNSNSVSVEGGKGNLVVGGSLGVTGAATLGSNLTVKGTLGVTGAATIGGITTINNNLSVKGTLGVTGAATLGSNLTVKGTLGVTGAATLDSSLTVGGTLGVTGAATFGGTTKITNSSSSTSTSSGALVVTGGVGIGNNLNVGGNLGVTGKITGYSGIKITNGNSYGISMYSGNGATTDSNILKVNSTAVSVEGSAGNLSVKGTLGVTGAATLGSLVVNDNLEVGGTFAVAGKAVLGSDLEVGATTDTTGATTGALVVAGGVGIGKNLRVKGELTTNKYINIASYGDATNEVGGINHEITTLVDTNKLGHIYLGAPPDDRKTPLHRLLMNRSSIQAYTTYGGTTTNEKGETVSIYKNPDVSYLYLNPCGGNVSISKSGSTTSINGDLGVSGAATTGALVVAGGVGIGGAINVGGSANIGNKITGKSGIKVFGGTSEFYSGHGGTSDTNILKVNSNGVSVEGGVGNLSVKGITTITNGSISTSTTTGALVVTGGVGIRANLNASSGVIGILEVKKGAKIYGNSGLSSGGIGLTVEGGIGSTDHDGGTGLYVKGGKGIGIGFDGLGIKVENGAEFYSGTGATTDSNILKVNSTGVSLEGGAGNLSVKGLLNVSGQGTFSGNIGIYGNAIITNSSSSTSTSSGALVVTGGVGIGNNLNVGGNLGVTGPATLGSITVSNGGITVSKGGITVSTNNITVSNGKVTASQGFFQTSDERLKNFKDDVLVDLDKLSSIPKKYFTWKTGDTKSLNIGTSAQELQKLYPELVHEDSAGNLTVAYDKLSIIALKAIDELQFKNKELEKRIDKLEKLLK